MGQAEWQVSTYFSIQYLYLLLPTIPLALSGLKHRIVRNPFLRQFGVFVVLLCHVIIDYLNDWFLGTQLFVFEKISDVFEGHIACFGEIHVEQWASKGHCTNKDDEEVAAHTCECRGSCADRNDISYEVKA
jgi:hypothetical protein